MYIYRFIILIIRFKSQHYKTNKINMVLKVVGLFVIDPDASVTC